MCGWDLGTCRVIPGTVTRVALCSLLLTHLAEVDRPFEAAGGEDHSQCGSDNGGGGEQGGGGGRSQASRGSRGACAQDGSDDETDVGSACGDSDRDYDHDYQLVDDELYSNYAHAHARAGGV